MNIYDVIEENGTSLLKEAADYIGNKYFYNYKITYDYRYNLCYSLYFSVGGRTEISISIYKYNDIFVETYILENISKIKAEFVSYIIYKKKEKMF